MERTALGSLDGRVVWLNERLTYGPEIGVTDTTVPGVPLDKPEERVNGPNVIPLIKLGVGSVVALLGKPLERAG